MRGELCISSATLLSFVALLLLIFMHAGQINTSSVSRSISMTNVNVSLYGQGLHRAFGDPIDGLYTNNASAPLGAQAGLRQLYKFGLYNHCAFVNQKMGICGNYSVAARFQPYESITSDMLTNYSQFTNAIISDTTFGNDGYLGSSSKAAYYMLLLGTICTGLAMVTGVLKHTVAFFASTAFSVLGSLLLLIGAIIWTVLVKRTESINNFGIKPNATPVPLGIIVSVGSGLYLLWASVACLLASIVPYMISCCTYRG